MSNTAKDRVVIRNIYYMMAYAFRTIDIEEYRRLGTEDFDRIEDLLAAILALGIGIQRRRGFERDYEEVQDNLHTVHGRIAMRETMRLRMDTPATVSCIYDEYSENTYKNQILKAAAKSLVDSPEVDLERRRELRERLLDLRDVDNIDPSRIEWSRLQYHRNNGDYQLLMNVCYMVVRKLLLTQDDGESRLASFVDSQGLHALYEKFVLEYFRKEHPELNASNKEIDRKVSDDAPAFLPHLYSDIALEHGNKVLIVDTKCYGTILQINYDREIFSPAHINQLTSYVVHEAYGSSLDVQGMLLYALTDNAAALNESWDEVGHRFHVRTLDLGQDFSGIAAQLDDVAGLVE